MTLFVEDGTGIFGSFSSQYTATNGSDTLTIEGHGLVSGYGPYIFTAGSGVLPGGITANSFYWVVVIDEDTIKLAESYADAIADTPVVINISSDGTDDATRLMEAANANSYLSVAEFETYHTARSNDYSAASTTAAKEAAILNAMDFVKLRWGRKFKGRLKFEEQYLDFPRSSLYDRYGRLVEGIPTNLKNAVAEYALRSIAAALMPDPAVQDNGLTITNSRTKIGPIEEEATYAGGSPQLKPYPKADLYLADYITSGGGIIRG